MKHKTRKTPSPPGGRATKLDEPQVSLAAVGGEQASYTEPSSCHPPNLPPRGEGQKLAPPQGENYFFALTLALTLTTAAHAEEPSGIPLPESIPFISSFHLTPMLKADATYDDNLLRTNTNETSDTVYSAAPSIAINSNWDNHALNLEAGVEAVRHQDTSEEDHENWHANLNGRIDIRDNQHLTLETKNKHFHEDRTDPESSDPTLPRAQVDQHTAEAEWHYTGDAVMGELTTSIDRFRYDSTPTTDYGVRNRDILTLASRFTWMPWGNWGIFIEPAYEKLNYARATDSTGINRDATRTRLTGGLIYAITDITHIELGTGIARLNPSDSTLKNSNTLALTTNLYWSPLEELNIRGGLNRTTDTTTLAGISSITRTTGNLTLAYAYNEHLIVRTSGSYQYASFENSTHNDEDWTFNIGNDYLFSDTTKLTLDYHYRNRDSTIATNSFTNNLVRLGFAWSL